MSAVGTILSLATSAGNADFTAGANKTVQVQLDASRIDERINEVQAEYTGKHVAE